MSHPVPTQEYGNDNGQEPDLKAIAEREKLADIEEDENEVLCEKCGEGTGNKVVGDESYNFCKGCNWVTHK